MIPRLKNIVDLVERIAPISTAEDWDNPGLQVGNPTQEIRRILIALDPTLEAVKEASARDAQLLLTHHPLIFPALSSLNQAMYPGNVIFEACRGGIAIVAAHTNLDVARGGINDMLASLFQLTGTQVLKKGEEAAGTGLGRIGDLRESAPVLSFAERIKSMLG